MVPEHMATCQWVDFPIEMVFAFFANPYNLPSLMSPDLKTKIERLKLAPASPVALGVDSPNPRKAVSAGTGSEIELSFRPIPAMPLTNTMDDARNRVCVEQQFLRCADSRAVRSLSASPWIQSWKPRNGCAGTLVTDDIEYAMPFGPLGRIAGATVRAQMEQAFAARQDRLPILLMAIAQSSYGLNQSISSA
jgi:ligand-binding SRPBCC domain-containing protein